MATEMDIQMQLRSLLQRGERETVEDLLWELVEQRQLYAVLRELEPFELARLAELLGDETFGEFLAELDPSDAADLLERLSSQEAADVLEAMAPDDAADVFARLDPDEARQILVEMEPLEAQELQELLSYPPETAGGRMTPSYVALLPDVRVDQAIAALRKVAAEVETIYYAYVVDEANHLLGVVSMRDLVLSPPYRTVGEIMTRDIVKVRATADQEEAARLLVEEGLLAIPVVDDEDRLLGIITVDDVADILEREVTEDIERLGGSQPLEVPYTRATPFYLWRRRIGWLLLLFVAEMYTGTVLRHFEQELEEAIALAFFVPLLIGTGGNAGSQVVTTLVRAMAVEGIGIRDFFRIFPKEFIAGLLAGVVMGTAGFLRAEILGVDPAISLTVGVALFCIVLWAVTVATLLPLLLRRLGIDPAVVSSPFIATLVDGTGLVIYFNVARIILHLHS
ncbi:magnesium transporter [Thermomicrobium roseum]|uniref:Magnesium transporter MgtE n=1 Tax=Thermomicrobium roseum (strain ATCC 27502 / DSM 5159 / P-2) TaxID=309801 RepID=B9KYL8_THERP|nr:magnesium transporter [Thermomicrobium roseum]ACM05121.1 magnesium transporter [Thermomicrobium roseum DSM 5159]